MIQPLKGRVLIQKTVESAESASGIVVIQSAKTTQNTTTSTGEILAVPTGHSLEVGKSVIFDEGWGNEVEDGLFLIDENAVKAYVNA